MTSPSEANNANQPNRVSFSVKGFFKSVLDGEYTTLRFFSVLCVLWLLLFSC